MIHLHSQYSLKYGVCSIDYLLHWYQQNGYPQAVLTDINNTTAILQASRMAQELNIRLVAGCDVRNQQQTRYIILAKNNRGFHELNTFLSQYLHAASDFPERAPHLSNCHVIYPLALAPKRLNENEWAGVALEDRNHYRLLKQKPAPTKTVALPCMTFRHKKDYNTHRLLRAIDQNCLLSKLSPSICGKEDHRLLSLEEVREQYDDLDFLVDQSLALLHNCQINFAFGDNAPPQNLNTYTGDKAEDFRQLQQLCEEGIAYRYPKVTPAIRARIDKEIAIIQQKDYLSYFLITWDFTHYARSKGYFYVGRGSGANSIVAYLLRITDVDPLELDLYFERFINLYRKNPPDFDIDFSWKDREDVTRYLFERYPNCALLCTYNTFQFRATVRELGKVFGLPKSEIDALSEGAKQPQQLDNLSALVLKYARYIEGLPSHLSVHAGGIVISEKPITWYSATFLPPKGYPTTQFSMLEAEDVGLYKFDVLSQRGLAKIHDTLTIIERNNPTQPPHDIHDIQYFKSDRKIKSLLREARALGCFYVESPAMRMLLQKLKVDDYLTLVAASSIIRPGVAHSGMMREYILRHKYPEKRKEAHPVLLAIMPDTYGVMVYQEDVIKVAHHFAGLDLGQADVLRRGMSGKFRSRAEFQKIEEVFFSNCKEKGYTEELAREVWRQIESFAGYAFSKGHSASYAVESYQSLYLKAYYPLEYMVATINNYGGYYRTEVYVHEARMLGGQIEAPCLLEGEWESRLIGRRIVLGFNLIQGIESKIMLNLLQERDRNGPFLHFQDLLNRVFLPLEQLLLLIRVDALRAFNEHRRNLLWQAHLFYNKRKSSAPSLSLFPKERKNFTLPPLEDSMLEMAFEQMELLGFPLCNPFDLIEESTYDGIPAQQIPLHLNQNIICYGYLIALKQSKTVKKEIMCFGNFIDRQGEVFDSVHFPETARRFPFRGKGIYRVEGRVTEDFGHFTIEAQRLTKIPFVEDVRYAESVSK